MRIVVAFCLFGAILGTVYAFAVYFSLDFIDDTLIDNRLSQEISHFEEHYPQNIAAGFPSSPHMTAYIETASMPSEIKRLVKGLGQGFHEIHHAGKEFHIAVKQQPQLNKPLYILYDVSTLEFTEKRKYMIAIVLLTGVILMVTLGLWIGLLTARRVIAPVTHLADIVKQSDPDNLPTDLSQSFSNDEVGTLSKTLEDAMLRIRSFIKREQQFTRDASHEL